MQARRTVGTDIGRHEVLGIVVVGDTSEVGHDAPLRRAGPCAVQRNHVGGVQRLDEAVAVVRAADVVVGVVRIRPGRADHHVQAVLLLEQLVVGQDVIPRQHRVLVAVVRTLAILVAAVLRLVRVEEGGGDDVAAVQREGGLEGQFLGNERDERAARCNQSVLAVAVVAATFQVLQRAGDIGAVEIVVVLAGIIRVHDRRVLRGVDDGQHRAATVGARAHLAGAVAVVVGIGDVGRHAQPLAHVALHIGPEVIAVEEGRLQHAFLVLIAGREVIAHLLVAVGHGHLVVLHVAGGVRLVPPVGLVGQSVGQRDEADFVHQFLVLGGVQRLDLVGHLREAGLDAQADLGVAGLPGLGGDEDHAVGGTRTVDGCRRGILQDLHGGNVVGREKFDVVHRHTIHDIQRVVAAVERGSATHADVQVAAGLAGRLDDADAGRLALHGLRGREDRTVLDVVGRHGRYGGGDIAALDGAVTDDHDFVQ